MPLLEVGLAASNLAQLLQSASGCEAAHVAIQEHTRKAVSATHPQAMTDAAARFRSLVTVRAHSPCPPTPRFGLSL